MTGLQMALAIAMIVVGLALIVIVLLQKDRQADASAMTGGGMDSSFFDKTKGHQKDASLAKATKIFGIIFVVLALATTCVILFI